MSSVAARNNYVEATNDKKKSRTGAVDRSAVTCYFCDKTGHFKSECPEKAQWEAAKVAKAAGAHSARLAAKTDKAFTIFEDAVTGAW
ncbi:hypothetical protein OBBRIDRAFT_95581 [Obba rivulosa]|uniref:CCHC-type domain-containing protein n=1 Tax=Obba rivulosa TaxID=1052685 RepID=A0A8E2DJY8_9APHY|nr:hypothetical protein OBBRIDRAFT_95581 [Obba rivulosa]